MRCYHLYELNKTQYFGDQQAQVTKVVFNENINACLVWIRHNDLEANTDTDTIINMEDNETLLYFKRDRGQATCKYYFIHLYFQDVKTGEKFLEDGCDKWYLINKLLGEIENFGFSLPSLD